MYRRPKIILLLIFLVIVFAGFALILRIKGRPFLSPNVIAEPEFNGEIEKEKENLFVERTFVNEDEKLEINLSQKASDFAERFGTYSFRSNFENIVDLKPFMTKKMRLWADEYIKTEKIADGFGITSRAVKTVLINSVPEKEQDLLKKTEVRFLVSLQRQETTSDKEKIYYQNIEIELVKEDGEWKINEAEWKE